MASVKPLSGTIQKGYTLPYGKPRNRIATLKFVQDIPMVSSDPGFRIVVETSERLHRLSEKPMLLLWGGKDFVFDADYYKQWRKYFPRAEYRFFDSAGHYLVEDEKEVIIHEINRFLKSHPIE